MVLHIFVIDSPLTPNEQQRLSDLVGTRVVKVLGGYRPVKHGLEAILSESSANIRQQLGEFIANKTVVPDVLAIEIHTIGAHEKTNDRREIREMLAKIRTEYLHEQATVDSIEEFLGVTS